jgi:hypothetical protein
MNMKKEGTIYETKFIVRCLEYGLEPHPTVGDYLPHDLLVSNSAGSIYKVQVKGTSCRIKDKGRRAGSSPRYRITAAGGGQKAPLDCSKVDVLACSVKGDHWYLIPCLKLKGSAIWLYPDVENSKAYYEQFRENWGFFLT